MSPCHSISAQTGLLPASHISVRWWLCHSLQHYPDQRFRVTFALHIYIKWYIFKPCLCHRGCVLTNCFFVQNERIASFVMACFLCSLINVCADLLVIFWQLWLWEVPTSAVWITHLSLVNSVKCKWRNLKMRELFLFSFFSYVTRIDCHDIRFIQQILIIFTGSLV